MKTSAENQAMHAPPRVASADATSTGYLAQTNSGLEAIIADNPGVRKLVDRWAANASILQPQAGDKATTIRFAMWSHSKESAGMRDEPFKDIIVVWQNNAGGQDMDLGIGVGCRGRVIGVYRLDQFAFSTMAEAKAANPKLPIKEIEKDKFLHISDDQHYVGSYEWRDMKVQASGPVGADVWIKWAIIDLATDGSVRGGGYPDGWSGRSYAGRFGIDGHTVMPTD